jgi:hypothetical protein
MQSSPRKCSIGDPWSTLFLKIKGGKTSCRNCAAKLRGGINGKTPVAIKRQNPMSRDSTVAPSGANHFFGNFQGLTPLAIGFRP